ncbi:hypothetical protein THTE_4218 [Thermogutta terrifontis]|uniref:Uncharacterized protein n=1 Tax=Thermogutta terrifontis TaxID=1331910 RepID=A0A286RLH2_9BACT|nr:hypothetical protein THTE_4218 [Thermogutta terrifontis]
MAGRCSLEGDFHRGKIKANKRTAIGTCFLVPERSHSWKAPWEGTYRQLVCQVVDLN